MTGTEADAVREVRATLVVRWRCLIATVGLFSVGTLCALAPSAIASPLTQTFLSTGYEQQYVVPDGVEQVSVTAVGAQGGSYGTAAGGLGGIATDTIAVQPGETLYVEVGSAGGSVPCGPCGGYNGGGNASSGAGGGGASDVRTAPASVAGSLDSRLVVAGGGGGAGFPGKLNGVAASGGGAGGDAGAAGSQGSSIGGFPGGEGGQPGTLSAGGRAEPSRVRTV